MFKDVHTGGFPLYGITHLAIKEDLLHRQHCEVFCRLYMCPNYSSAEVIAVEEDWLPLIQPQFCAFSPPLEQPPPFFDSQSGTVRCYRSCTYGQCSISLLLQPCQINISPWWRLLL